MGNNVLDCGVCEIMPLELFPKFRDTESSNDLIIYTGDAKSIVINCIAAFFDQSVSNDESLCFVIFLRVFENRFCFDKFGNFSFE